MLVKLLFGACCSVYAEADSAADETPFEKALKGMHRQADAKGMAEMLQRYAAGGRRSLPRSLLHSADPANEIWEVCKGDLRAFLFFDGNEVVVLSTVSVKKGQQANPREVDAARRLRRRYVEAKQRGEIVIIR